MDDLFLLGRLIFGGFFLFNGANHFLMNSITPMMHNFWALPDPTERLNEM